MSRTAWSDLIKQLESKGIQFGAGLSDVEITNAEGAYQLRFPNDLRAFLQTALPIGIAFPNWRSLDDAYIEKMLEWPIEGILFDVEYNDFWLSEWGAKPKKGEEIRLFIEEKVRNAPRLIPIYLHRMMPDRPINEGNPVFSIYQTDIIYYGFDLDDYFRHEFDLKGRKVWPPKIRPIEFWDIDRWQDLQYR